MRVFNMKTMIVQIPWIRDLCTELEQRFVICLPMISRQLDVIFEMILMNFDVFDKFTHTTNKMLCRHRNHHNGIVADYYVYQH